MKRFWLLLVLLVLTFSACREKPLDSVPASTPIPTSIPAPTPIPGALYVDATQQLGLINPFVYGANHGPWAAVSFDLWDEMEASGVTFLRFPGGKWGDENNLRETHIDGFIALCQQIGAQRQLSVRLRGGTPEQAAALVRYANIEQQYDIRYWSIGNEPGLYHSKPGFDGYDTARLNREWRAIAEAMLAVDPDIQLIGPEVTQYTGNPASGTATWYSRKNVSNASGSATSYRSCARSTSWSISAARRRSS